VKRIFRISDAARKAGVCATSVRNYERLGLISFSRDSTGHRVFDDEAIREIRQVYTKLNEKRR